MDDNILIRVGADITNFSRNMRAATAGLDGFQKANKETFDSFKQVGAVVTGAGVAIAVGLGASVKSAASFESAFAGVRKTVDASEEEFDALRKGILDMTKVLPASAEEIAGVAESAGQLGIEKKNILAFTRTMIDLGESTNLTADQAATSFARFANITKMPQTEFDRLGSTVVALGNTMATTEAEIVSMAMRLAAQGRQVGMTEADIMALAGTMSSLGIEAEAGGSAMTMVLTKMQKAVGAGGAELEVFAKAAGMSSKAFAEAFQNEPIKALELLARGLGNSADAGENMNVILEDLGIKGIREADVMKRLAGNSELLGEAVGTANNAWNENNALTKEAAERYETFESKVAIFKNVLRDLSITVGDVLLPSLISIMDSVTRVIEWIGRLNPKIIEVGVKFTALSAVLMLVIGPLLLLVGFIPQILKGFGAVRTVVSLVGKGFSKFGGQITRLLKSTKLLRSGMSLLGRAVGLLTGPIGWVVMAVVGLVTVFVRLYKTNEEFRKRITAMWDAVVSKTREAVAAFVRVVGPAFERVKDAVLRVVGALRTGVTGGFENISKVVSKGWAKFGDFIVSGMDKVMDVWNRMWPNMEKVFLFAWDNFQKALEIGTDLIVGLLDSIALLLSGDIAGAWKLATASAKKAVSEIGKALKEFGTIIATYFIDKFDEAKKAIKDKMTEWVLIVAAKMVDIKNSIVTKISDWTSAVLNWFTSMPSKILSKLTEWGAAMDKWTSAQNEENKRQFKEWGVAIIGWLASLPQKISDGLISWGVSIGTWFLETKTMISEKLAEWAIVIIEWLASVPGLVQVKLLEWTLALATWFVDMKTSITDWMTGWLLTISTWFTDTKSSITEKLAEWLVAISIWFTNMPSNIATWLAEWLSRMVTWFKSIPAKITSLLEDWWTAIKNWFKGVPDKPEVKNAGKNLIDKVREGTEEKKSEFMDKLGALIIDVITGVLMFVGVAFIAAGRELINRILEGFQNKKTDLQNKAKNLLIDAAKKMSEVDFVQVGKDIIRGLISGIGSMADGVKRAARSIAAAAKNAITDFFVVKSPSRVMMGIGVNVGEGLAIGIMGMRGAVAKSAAELSEAASITPDLSYATPSANYGSLSAALSGEVNVNQRESMLVGAIESLERKLANLVVEMDGQTVGVLVAPTVSESINAEANGATRGRGRRRI